MICIIDDDVSLLRALQRLLVADGRVVRTFPSAEAFLEFEHRDRVDCLILDVHLGGLSGFELHEQLTASGARIPAIIITAHDDTRTREMARRAGIVAYLRKPFDDTSLMNALNRAVGVP
ncbi:MAG TPA: response regulator [Methylomirabilota bacterium]|jgi:FixJ family two-component response regulator